MKLPTLIAPAKGQSPGIGRYTAERMRAGDDTKQILRRVHRKLPDRRAAKTGVYIIRK